MEEATPTPVNTCVTCKHLLGKRTNLEDAAEKWRCQHPSNIFHTSIDVVTGVTRVTYAYATIYAVRDPANTANCGEAGINWELYEHPKVGAWVPTATATTPELTAAERLAKLRKPKNAISLGDI